MNDTLIVSKFFEIANLVAMLSWVLLIFLPQTQLTKRLVRTGLASLVLALAYWVAMSTMLVTGIPEGAGFSSFEGVRLFFTSEWGILAGWIHYLAFDLLVGVSVYQRLSRNSAWVRGICLFLIFMLGPIGWSFSKLVRSEGNGDANASII